MGFRVERTESRSAESDMATLSHVLPEDLLKYGLIPEFIGRLPVIATLDPLDEAGADRDPGRAEERAGQAVPAALRPGRQRGPGLHGGRAGRDRATRR